MKIQRVATSARNKSHMSPSSSIVSRDDTTIKIISRRQKPRRQGISELMKRELEGPASRCRVSGRPGERGPPFENGNTRGTRLRKQTRGGKRDRTDRSREKGNGSAERRKKGETRSIYLLNVFRAFVGVCRIPTGNTSRLKERCRVWLANPGAAREGIATTDRIPVDQPRILTP